MSATVTSTMTGAELNKVVCEAVAQAMKAAGFGGPEKPRPPPKLAYSIKEAASVASVGRTSIYLAIRRGELRSLRKGSRRIILDRDLRRWLEGLPPSHA
jgi:excisionase family DNA binding protein